VEVDGMKRNKNAVNNNNKQTNKQTTSVDTNKRNNT
jgi:hypothetical protein